MPLTEEPVRPLKVSHHVQQPPAASRKKGDLQQQLKHIHLSQAAGFSSDEDDPEQDGAVSGSDPKEAERLDPSDLTDDALRVTLLKYGVKPGPVVASTRALYERKLRTLLQPSGPEELNEAEIGILYSDSEGEEEKDERHEDKASGSEQDDREAAEMSDQTKPPSSKGDLLVQEGDFVYSQCFLVSPRLRADPSRNKEPRSKWSSKNALKPPERTRTLCSQIPAGISKTSSTRLRTGLPPGPQSVTSSHCSSPEAFSITQMVKEQMEIRRSLSASSDKEFNSRSMLEQSPRSCRLKDEFRPVDRQLYHTPWSSPRRQETKAFHSFQLPREPVQDVLKDLFPNTRTIPTGLYAAPRRPIKGAAGRPVQLAYPDPPVSPTTQERLEVQHRLVPAYIQILVFFTVVCVLYFIYVNVGDRNPGLALLESLNQWSEGEEGV
ncbi:LEM domain-containing protein 1 isoform X3 [Nothobranchius furzeri]|uniref:LEM domain-containing protein 1 isoform X3 n=1 Tax=Nothobranchius furzeri TaxID=105023 RepID=UPI003904AF4C